jgi:DNA repair protein RadC
MLEEREIFGALWLDAKNRLLACEYIALGTCCGGNSDAVVC